MSAMPPRYKKSTTKQESTFKFNTKDKLKKMKKPKKINRKLRDRVVEVKGLNQDIQEALEAAREALWDGEYADISSRLEQIEMDLKVQKTHIQYIDTRLWQKADQAIEECVQAAVTMSSEGHIITKKALSENWNVSYNK